MTKLNQAILNMIRSSEGHLTAEEAFLLAKKENISVSLASIYRILTKLADEGYIRKISVQGQADIFDKTIEDHEHLVCSVCGKIKDIKIKNFSKLLKEETGVNNISSYTLCINYICDDCKDKIHSRRKK